MNTINRNQARKKVVSSHTSMVWQSNEARLSVRKTDGEYIVRLEDYETGKVTKTAFKTLPGALVCADNLRSYYL